jgi:hypothetical protein
MERILGADWPEASDAAFVGSLGSGMVLIPIPWTSHVGGTSVLHPNGSMTFTNVQYILFGGFSDSFDNYMLDIEILGTDGNADPYMLLYGNTGYNTSNWSFVLNFASSTSVTSSSLSGQSSVWIGDNIGTRPTRIQMFIYGPYLAQSTVFRTVMSGDQSDSLIGNLVGVLADNNPYYAMYFDTAFGATFSGKVSLYGMGQ